MRQLQPPLWAPFLPKVPVDEVQDLQCNLSPCGLVPSGSGSCLGCTDCLKVQLPGPTVLHSVPWFLQFGDGGFGVRPVGVVQNRGLRGETVVEQHPMVPLPGEREEDVLDLPQSLALVQRQSDHFAEFRHGGFIDAVGAKDGAMEGADIKGRRSRQEHVVGVGDQVKPRVNVLISEPHLPCHQRDEESPSQVHP